jgi:acyl carrier protein
VANSNGQDVKSERKDASVDRAAIAAQIVDMVVAEGMVDRDRIKPDSTLESLEIASMDIVMILLSIEEKFGVYIPIDGELGAVKNFSEFVDTVTARIVAGRA